MLSVRKKYFVIFLVTLSGCVNSNINLNENKKNELSKENIISKIKKRVNYNKKIRKISKTEKKSRKSKHYALTTQTALKFSGHVGVRAAGLDAVDFVNVFTSMIKHESNFNSKAVSSAGAKGLGQLMPGTAKMLGVKDPFKPRENLNGAATYLTQMMKKFGSVELALAAYNAGPGAVQKYGGIPPYKETRNYVAKIIRAAGVRPKRGKKNVKRTKQRLGIAGKHGLVSAAKIDPQTTPPNNQTKLDGVKSVWEF